MRTRTNSPDRPDRGWTAQETGRTADFFFAFILDGPDLLDRPSGPSGALAAALEDSGTEAAALDDSGTEAAALEDSGTEAAALEDSDDSDNDSITGSIMMGRRAGGPFLASLDKGAEKDLHNPGLAPTIRNEGRVSPSPSPEPKPHPRIVVSSST